MNDRIFVVTEVERHPEGMPEFCVLGVFSTKEYAQQALVAAIRSTMECNPEASFSQEVTEEGILVAAPGVGEWLYNIVARNLDETE